MSITFYKILHIVGLVASFGALAAAALHAMNGGTRDTNKARGLLAGTHGVGLLLALVGGFGMLAKMNLGMPGFVHAKLALWLLVGGLLMVPMKKPELAKPVWFLLPVLAGVGAWLGLAKPF